MMREVLLFGFYDAICGLLSAVCTCFALFSALWVQRLNEIGMITILPKMCQFVQFNVLHVRVLETNLLHKGKGTYITNHSISRVYNEVKQNATQRQC